MHTFGILLSYDFLDHYTTSLRYPNLFKLIDIVICTKINQLTPSYIRNCPFWIFWYPKNRKNTAGLAGVGFYKVIKLPIFFLKVENSILRFFTILLHKPTWYTFGRLQTQFQLSMTLLPETGEILTRSLIRYFVKMFDFGWFYEISN